MSDVSPMAGKPVTPEMLIDVATLTDAYYSLVPDAAMAEQRVSFGTSGHRGAALKRSFNEAHILAISQAACLYRAKAGINGPLYLGRDTHALSQPAFQTALEVLVANNVDVRIDHQDGYTPTPVISH